VPPSSFSILGSSWGSHAPREGVREKFWNELMELVFVESPWAPVVGWEGRARGRGREEVIGGSGLPPTTYTDS